MRIARETTEEEALQHGMHDLMLKELLQNFEVEQRSMTIFEPSAQSWRINRWLDNG